MADSPWRRVATRIEVIDLTDVRRDGLAALLQELGEKERATLARGSLPTVASRVALARAARGLLGLSEEAWRDRFAVAKDASGAPRLERAGGAGEPLPPLFLSITHSKRFAVGVAAREEGPP